MTIFELLNFQKSTKKVEFAALLKYFFNFVPRGTNVENFFEQKILIALIHFNLLQFVYVAVKGCSGHF